MLDRVGVQRTILARAVHTMSLVVYFPTIRITNEVPANRESLRNVKGLLLIENFNVKISLNLIIIVLY